MVYKIKRFPHSSNIFQFLISICIFPFYIATNSVDYTLTAMIELLTQVYYWIWDDKITGHPQSLAAYLKPSYILPGCKQNLLGYVMETSGHSRIREKK